MSILKALPILFAATAWAQSPLDDGGKHQPVGAPVAPVPVASRPARDKEPKIVFERTSHDFGEVEEGKEVPTEFTFKNEGKGPLQILRAVPGCACSTPILEAGGLPYVWGTPIPVGGSGRVRVLLRTTGFPGQKDTFVSLFTNDPAFPETAAAPFGEAKLDIHALIQRPYVFDPADGAVKLGEGPLADLAEQTILVKSAKGIPFQIVGFEPPDALLDTHAEPVDATATQWRVGIALSPSQPFGKIAKEVRLLLKPAALIPIKLNVTGELTGPVRVDPIRGVHFLNVTKGRVATKNVYLKNTDPEHRLKIEGLRLLDPMDQRAYRGGDAREVDARIKDNLIVEVNETDPGKVNVLNVIVKETMPSGSFHAVLAFRCGVPGGAMGTEEIRLPITGLVR